VDAPAPTATASSALATASTPAPPAYDLAADLRERLDAARGQLGEQTASQVEARVFLIVAARRDSVYEASVKLAGQALDALFNGRFSARPDEAITAYILPAKAPYDAFCKKHFGEPCASPLGMYEPSRREIVVNAGPGVSTLTHELVHPIVRHDFPGAPEWLSEGLASLFEAPVISRPGEIHGAKNWRLPRLLAALASKTESATTRLDALFGMTDAEFERNEALHKATARYACQWLDERGKLWSFYRTWRDAGSSDASGERAFTEIVGATPKEANQEWVKWVRAL
jgi:hypothetical protein